MPMPALQPLIDLQLQLQKSPGKPKAAVVAPWPLMTVLKAKVEEVAAAGMEEVVTTAIKWTVPAVTSELKEEVLATDRSRLVRRARSGQRPAQRL